MLIQSEDIKEKIFKRIKTRIGLIHDLKESYEKQIEEIENEIDLLTSTINQIETMEGG